MKPLSFTQRDPSTDARDDGSDDAGLADLPLPIMYEIGEGFGPVNNLWINRGVPSYFVHSFL
jgi:hypothetical protein